MVTSLDIGRDLARRLGTGHVVLMRGNGAVAAGSSIRVATIAALMLNQQARLERERAAGIFSDRDAPIPFAQPPYPTGIWLPA